MALRVSRRLLAVPTALVLVLAGCTNPGGDAASDIELVPVDPPAAIDAAAIGLVEVSSDAEAPATGTGAATSSLAFFPELAARSAAFLTDLGVLDPEVGLLDVVAADRQVIGVKIHPDPTTASASDGEAGSVFYGDVATGATWSARDLLETECAHELEDALRLALSGDGDPRTSESERAASQAAATASAADDADADTDPDADADLLSDLRFSSDGDLLVVAPAGDRAWSVPMTDAVELTGAGRLVRGAARQGGVFLGPISTDPLTVTPASVPLPPVPFPPDPPPAGGPPPVDCGVTMCVALTFDDGPGQDTPRLLDVLAAKNVKATFFLVGNRVSRNPATAKAIADAGHALGNHTWNHPDLTKADAATRASEISGTTQAILDATGKPPTSMRPPYGAVDDDVRAELRAAGLPVVLWDVDSEDWRSKNVEATTTAVMAKVKPGSIVLLHDIHASTVDAVPSIIDQLAAQGYTLVTVDQLLPDMQPGEKYFSRHR